MLANSTPILLLFGVLCRIGAAYKPVVLIHGILAEKGCMDVVGNRIKEVSFWVLYGAAYGV
jgi:hypothetical protein